MPEVDPWENYHYVNSKPRGEYNATPQQDEKEFIKRWAPSLMRVMNHDELTHSDKAALKGIYSDKYDEAWLVVRLTHYASTGEFFGKNAFWFRNRLNDEYHSPEIKASQSWYERNKERFNR